MLYLIRTGGMVAKVNCWAHGGCTSLVTVVDEAEGGRGVLACQLLLLASSLCMRIVPLSDISLSVPSVPSVAIYGTQDKGVAMHVALICSRVH